MIENKKPTILIVDDVVSNLMMLSDLLSDDYEIKIAKSAQKGLEILKKNNYEIDLILLDIVMPEMDGYEMCKILKSDEATKSIPIIFVTAKDDAKDEEYGLNIGAIDYIIKPFNKTIVKLRVGNQIEMKLKSDMLEELSMYDGLTNIPNRRYFDKKLDEMYRSKLRRQGAMSLLMIDIDYFKLYNDNYGHGKGDETLKKVALALDGSLSRGGDFLARYGGEEFVVLLDEDKEKEAKQVAKKLLQSVRNLEIEHAFSKVEKIVTISVGVYALKVDSGTQKDDILQKADKALYMAKEDGRNRSVSYE